MKLVELSIKNNIVDAVHKRHITHVMQHSTSAPNERVLSTTQLTKLSSNHSSVVVTPDVFMYVSCPGPFWLRHRAGGRFWSTLDANDRSQLSRTAEILYAVCCAAVWMLHGCRAFSKCTKPVFDRTRGRCGRVLLVHICTFVVVVRSEFYPRITMVRIMIWYRTMNENNA